MVILLFILAMDYLKSVNKHAYLAILLLLFAVLLLFSLGLIIIKLIRKFSSPLFGKDVGSEYIDLVFVGAILLAISQLFGPLVASTYPMIFGPDASDYRLEFEHIYKYFK